MTEFTVTVEKLTDDSLLRRANSFTTHKESRMSLAAAYRHGHSPIRTQLFWVELRDIPLFVASQLVRSHVGVQFFQLSKRPDRGGSDFRKVCEDIATKAGTIFKTEGYSFDEEYQHRTETAHTIRLLPEQFDRYAPTDLAIIVNAEALITMSHKRMCKKASDETHKVFLAIREKIGECDPDLQCHLVPTCVFRNGICPEPNSCLYYASEPGRSQLQLYQKIMKIK